MGDLVKRLCTAAFECNIAEVHSLLAQHADPNSTVPVEMCSANKVVRGTGVTALYSAAANTSPDAAGRLECVRILLEHGANVDAQCPSHGSTPLHGAAYKNHPDVVVLLRQYGARFDILNRMKELPWKHPNANIQAEMKRLIETTTPSLAAAHVPTATHDLQSSLLQPLSEIGINPPVFAPTPAQVPGPSTDSDPVEIFCKAAFDGELTKLQLARPNVSDINALNKRGQPALYCAARYCHLECVVYLLEQGADPAVPEDKNKSPPIQGCCWGYTTVSGNEDRTRLIIQALSQSKTGFVDPLAVNAVSEPVWMNRDPNAQVLLQRFVLAAGAFRFAVAGDALGLRRILSAASSTSLHRALVLEEANSEGKLLPTVCAAHDSCLQAVLEKDENAHEVASLVDVATGKTLLHMATLAKADQVVRHLLDKLGGKAKAIATTVDKQNQSALLAPTSRKVCHELNTVRDRVTVDVWTKYAQDGEVGPLSRSAPVCIGTAGDVDVNALNAHGFTALHRACSEARVKVVQHLVHSRGADVNVLNSAEDSGTPLHAAVWYNGDKNQLEDRSVAVRCLLDAQADTGIKNRYGLTPIEEATWLLPTIQQWNQSHKNIGVCPQGHMCSLIRNHFHWVSFLHFGSGGEDSGVMPPPCKAYPFCTNEVECSKPSANANDVTFAHACKDGHQCEKISDTAHTRIFYHESRPMCTNPCPCPQLLEIGSSHATEFAHAGMPLHRPRCNINLGCTGGSEHRLEFHHDPLPESGADTPSLEDVEAVDLKGITYPYDYVGNLRFLTECMKEWFAEKNKELPPVDPDIVDFVRGMLPIHRFAPEKLHLMVLYSSLISTGWQILFQKGEHFVEAALQNILDHDLIRNIFHRHHRDVTKYRDALTEYLQRAIPFGVEDNETIEHFPQLAIDTDIAKQLKKATELSDDGWCQVHTILRDICFAIAKQKKPTDMGVQKDKILGTPNYVFAVHGPSPAAYYGSIIAVAPESIKQHPDYYVTPGAGTSYIWGIKAKTLTRRPWSRVAMRKILFEQGGKSLVDRFFSGTMPDPESEKYGKLLYDRSKLHPTTPGFDEYLALELACSARSCDWVVERSYLLGQKLPETCAYKESDFGDARVLGLANLHMVQQFYHSHEYGYVPKISDGYQKHFTPTTDIAADAHYLIEGHLPPQVPLRLCKIVVTEEDWEKWSFTYDKKAKEVEQLWGPSLIIAPKAVAPAVQHDPLKFAMQMELLSAAPRPAETAEDAQIRKTRLVFALASSTSASPPPKCLPMQIPITGTHLTGKLVVVVRGAGLTLGFADRLPEKCHHSDIAVLDTKHAQSSHLFKWNGYQIHFGSKKTTIFKIQDGRPSSQLAHQNAGHHDGPLHKYVVSFGAGRIRVQAPEAYSAPNKAFVGADTGSFGAGGGAGGAGGAGQYHVRSAALQATDDDQAANTESPAKHVLAFAGQTAIPYVALHTISK